jgi:tRNA(Phe) wybutosine-synthesizing methylase Tyw3
MSIQQIQEQLINQINAINDKNILMMIEEELRYHIKHKDNLTDSLTKEEVQELTELANEPIEGNTIPLSEFKNVMAQWRMKL